MKTMIVGALLTLLMGFAGAASAQAPVGAAGGRPQMTRAELTDRLAWLEQLSGSAEQRPEVRGEATREAAMVSERLTSGDLRVGDQVVLSVEGEVALSDTFTVRPGQVLTLPGVGDISVAGVLRSELKPHMTAALGRFIRDPIVQAESLVRVVITGQVGRPGFYGVRAEELLSQAIMAAGGPGAGANLKGVYVERSGERIWTGDTLQQALADGRTLDQLSLQAGDQIVVPAARQGMGGRAIGIATGALSSIAILISVFR
jgi:protein involved in polysaccharide export with SLBB domain